MEANSHFSLPFRMSSTRSMGCSNSREWDNPPPYEPYSTGTNAPPYTPFPPVNNVRSPYIPRSTYGGYQADMSPTEFGFGIEIEAVVQPWKARPNWIPAQYYERLAQALRNRDLPAKADSCTESYRKHPEHYGKWFITRDGSLATRSGCIALEAVSPKMSTDENWEEHIKLFWEAMTKVFKVQNDTSCGSHIHVAPIGRRWTLDELKKIAFAVCIYESYVCATLPSERRDNQHCERNSKVGSRLGSALRLRTSAGLQAIAYTIKATTNANELCSYMQGSIDNRKVLWNFQNTVSRPGYTTSGTIEFRGGRHLRGKVRTLRWITFAIAFISMALEESLLNRSGPYNVPSTSGASLEIEAAIFWSKVKKYAYKLQMDGNIPVDYRMMNETKRQP